MTKKKEIKCQCGSGLKASTVGYSKSGAVVLTRCSKCEPSVSDSRTIGAITSRR